MSHSSRSCTVFAVALLVSAFACNKSSGSDPAPSNPAEPATPAATPAEATGIAGQPGAARPQVVDAGEVRALVDRWLAAQNKGDFDAYEALYASRFDGVRRSGPRMVRLDRKGWIADRKRMFKRPMRVSIDDVKIEVLGTAATVHFVQTWGSGKYEDIGPKQLIVVREGDALRIAREEMLSSTVIDADARIAAGTDLADKNFAFVMTIDGADHVVLAALPAGTEARNPTLVTDGDDGGGPEAVTVAATVAGVPPEVAAWQGQKVRSGDCVATIGAIRAVSRVVPHFSTVQMWNGTPEGEEGGGTPYTRAEIAQDAFYADSAVLVGKLDDMQPAGCRMDGYARHASLPAAPVFETSSTGPLRDAAIAAFRHTRTYQELQKDFRSSPEGAAGGLWDEFVADGLGDGTDDGSGPRVNIFSHGDTVLALVQASVGVGCGQYEASLSTLFKVEESGKRPTFVLLHETSGVYTVEEALIMDTGSEPEDAGQVMLLVRDHRGLDRTLLALDGTELRTLRVPYFDCDC